MVNKPPLGCVWRHAAPHPTFSAPPLHVLLLLQPIVSLQAPCPVWRWRRRQRRRGERLCRRLAASFTRVAKV